MENSTLLILKRGYLNEDFRFFHLKDKKSEEYTFHYHDFNKIVIFISGNVTYVIEGKYYKLRPWDILFIGSNELHKPIITPDSYYERIIIWASSSYLESYSTNDSDLLTCFHTETGERFNLFRLNTDSLNIIKDIVFSLEKAIKDRSFGSKLLQNSYFVQLIVYLNRLVLGAATNKDEKDIQYDQRAINIIKYINGNLENDLSIDNISSKFYINRYYLMHDFKRLTGYTLHSYILQKRLAKAAVLIKKRLPAVSVSEQCGFQDYSSFVRAFKRNFGLSPRQYYKAVEEIRQSYDGNCCDDEDYGFRE